MDYSNLSLFDFHNVNKLLQATDPASVSEEEFYPSTPSYFLSFFLCLWKKKKHKSNTGLALVKASI